MRGHRALRSRIRKLEARQALADAPTPEEVLAAWDRVAERARAKLCGEPVDAEAASRDEDLLERAGYTDEALEAEAEEARQKLLSLRPEPRTPERPAPGFLLLSRGGAPLCADD
jgi:hypothetical protein